MKDRPPDPCFLFSEQALSATQLHSHSCHRFPEYILHLFRYSRVLSIFFLVCCHNPVPFKCSLVFCSPRYSCVAFFSFCFHAPAVRPLCLFSFSFLSLLHISSHYQVRRQVVLPSADGLATRRGGNTSFSLLVLFYYDGLSCRPTLFLLSLPLFYGRVLAFRLDCRQPVQLQLKCYPSP